MLEVSTGTVTRAFHAHMCVHSSKLHSENLAMAASEASPSSVLAFS